MTHGTRSHIAVFVALALALAAVSAAAQTKLLRFPAIHGDTIAFTYAGDIWTAPAAGGTAKRLTAHPGMELFARFSPDGKWIAFTGQHDGDEQVYVIPAAGGVPTQGIGGTSCRFGFHPDYEASPTSDLRYYVN